MGWFKNLKRQLKPLPADADERREAIKDLHAIGDANATPTFIRALRDDDFEVQIAAAEALDIALTKRGKHDGADIPMCGVPVHSAESYLQRLIRDGHRVAER